MAAQLYFEDVQEGMEIPTFEMIATSRKMVMHCAAYEDYSEIHHDKDVAQKSGFPDTIVPGLMTSSLLAELLVSWMGPEGLVRKFKTSYRRPHYKGEKIVCKGKVTGKRVQGDDRLVECEVWAENDKGEVSTPGTATVSLPSRA